MLNAYSMLAKAMHEFTINPLERQAGKRCKNRKKQNKRHAQHTDSSKRETKNNDYKSKSFR